MGEEKFVQKPLVKALNEAIFAPEANVSDLRVDTPGGRFQVRWEEGGSATALGQLPFLQNDWRLLAYSVAGWNNPLSTTPVRMRQNHRMYWVHGYCRFLMVNDATRM